MSNIICLVLKNKHGQYEYKEISDIDKGNSIKISNSDYNKMIQGESVTLKEKDIDTSKNINLVFDKDALIQAAISSGKSLSEAEKSVDYSLKTLGDNISNINYSTEYGLTALDISFNKKHKLEEPYEIDIDSISPGEVIKKIQEKVIGQDDAIELIVRQMYDYQKALNKDLDEDTLKELKCNMLFDGPTGTGKTFIMKQVLKYMSIPMIKTSATIYTATGYRGVPLYNMLVELLDNAGGNLEAAQRGTIIIDEFDKLGKEKDDKESMSIKKQVQKELLTFIEGATFPIEYKGKTINFDTSKVTFVCLGAFTDLREEKQQNLDENGNYQITTEDYIEAGITRELVGRFKLYPYTRDLNVEDLVRILTESSDSILIMQSKKIKENYNRILKWDDSILEKIAQAAYNLHTGVRGLQSIVTGISNKMLPELQDNIGKSDGKEIWITEELLNKVLEGPVRQGLGK